MNQKTKHRRKNKKNSSNSNNDDAYHMAYQNYQYRSVYFTYSNEAPGVASLSFITTTSPLKIIYHNQYNSISSSTTTTTTTIAASSTQNSDQDVSATCTDKIIPIPSSSLPPPGTPLCYYKASYLVKYDAPNDINKNNGIEIIADMIVHQHVNGLCVVCVANLETILLQQQESPPINMDESSSNNNSNNNKTIQFQYQVQVTSSELSLAQKRKRNTKQLQGKKITTSTNDHNNIGLVQPSDTLATLIVPSQPIHPSSSIGNASMIQETNENPTAQAKTTTTTTTTLVRFPCCVLGSIIELNEQFMNNYNNNNNESHNEDNLVPTTNHSSSHTNNSHKIFQLLQLDPYLKGYLAIILPSGPFPPPHHSII